MSRTFGQMVREARLERHLSMGQLAAAVDRSTASVRRWERDDGLPSPEVIDALVLRLGLDKGEVDRVTGFAEPQPVEPSEPTTIDEGDPIDVVPLADAAVAVEAAPLASAAPQPTIVPRPPVVWPTSSAPVTVVAEAPADQNILQKLRDPDRPWIGYIRALLTIVVLGVLAYVLLWAVPEFLDAFGEMWDSLWQDEGGTTSALG